MLSDTSYTDEKGRTRWRRNDEIAVKLKELHDLLVIGGYDASHAARYPKLAYVISRHGESIIALHEQNRLRELPGVAQTVETILCEIIETGPCHKMTVADVEAGYTPPPPSVLELTALPGLGALTARRLYTEHGIESRAQLAAALDSDALIGFKGLGPKLRDAIKIMRP